MVHRKRLLLEMQELFSSKRKVVVVDPFVAGGDDASTSPEKKKLREVDDLTEADANTVQTFNSKLDPLKLVGPPIADAAFKTYMTDQIQKATQLITELRIKKKSADRRNGFQDQDQQGRHYVFWRS